MVRSVLLCFGRRNFYRPISTQDACAFYSFLSEDLQNLEKSLAEGPVSLRWLIKAMNLLKRMQIELLALFKKCEMPVFFGSEEDWLNQYMQETAALLDLCNSLKSAISGINRYRILIDLVTQNILEGNLNWNWNLNHSCMFSLENIDFGRTDGANRLGREISFQGFNHRNNKSIAVVMLAAKCTMIVISALLISAIVSPLSIDTRVLEELTYKFPQLKPFVEMLTALVVRFHERASKQRGLVLAEHKVVDTAVEELKARAAAPGAAVGEQEREKLVRSARLLRTSSDELREGIEMFDAVVDEVFEVVIKGRNEMLGVFRDGLFSVG